MNGGSHAPNHKDDPGNKCPRSTHRHAVILNPRSSPISSTHKMPPILRLDSTGEVARDDGPDHLLNKGPQSQRSSYWRGTPSSYSNLMGRTFSLPPKSLSSHNLTQTNSRTMAQGGLSVLDDLMTLEQSGLSVKRKMFSQGKVPPQFGSFHGQRPHGHWGGIHQSSMAHLPRGVFPCHVFRAQQYHSFAFPSLNHSSRIPFASEESLTDRLASTLNNLSVHKFPTVDTKPLMGGAFSATASVPTLNTVVQGGTCKHQLQMQLGPDAASLNREICNSPVLKHKTISTDEQNMAPQSKSNSLSSDKELVVSNTDTIYANSDHFSQFDKSNDHACATWPTKSNRDDSKSHSENVAEPQSESNQCAHDADCPDALCNPSSCSSEVHFQLAPEQRKFWRSLSSESSASSDLDEGDWESDDGSDVETDSKQAMSCFFSQFPVVTEILSPCLNRQKSASSTERNGKGCLDVKAADARWKKFYCTIGQPLQRTSKVQFSCGSGIDNIFEYEGDSRTLMEFLKEQNANKTENEDGDADDIQFAGVGDGSPMPGSLAMNFVDKDLCSKSVKSECSIHSKTKDNESKPTIKDQGVVASNVDREQKSSVSDELDSEVDFDCGDSSDGENEEEESDEEIHKSWASGAGCEEEEDEDDLEIVFE